MIEHFSKIATIFTVGALAISNSEPSGYAPHTPLKASDGLRLNLTHQDLVDMGCNVTNNQASATYETESRPPVPLSSGNYDFWDIAKVELEQDPETCQARFVNAVQFGEPGYVYGLGDDGMTPPYKVEGYEFVQETEMGGGVSIFEYTPTNPTDSNN